jgi:hypothetical protein
MVEPRTGQAVGWCAPDSDSTCVSADHLARAGFFLRAVECSTWEACGEADPRMVRVQWRDGKRDLAGFVHGDEKPRPWLPMRYARKLPEPQERICWRAYLVGPRPTPTVFCGAYVGRNAVGALVVDGAVERGASGSPAVNEAGEVVGIVTASDNPSEGYHPGGIVLADREAFQLLQMMSNFRAVGLLTPVIGGPRR